MVMTVLPVLVSFSLYGSITLVVISLSSSSRLLSYEHKDEQSRFNSDCK